MESVTVLEFTTFVAPYRTGEQAGFDDETALRYVNARVARVVRAGVPRVANAIRLHDSLQTLDEVRKQLEKAEKVARSELEARPKDPDAVEALRMAHDGLARLSLVERDLKASHPISDTDTRGPSARSRAA